MPQPTYDHPIASPVAGCRPSAPDFGHPPPAEDSMDKGIDALITEAAQTAAADAANSEEATSEPTYCKPTPKTRPHPPENQEPPWKLGLTSPCKFPHCIVHTRAQHVHSKTIAHHVLGVHIQKPLPITCARPVPKEKNTPPVPTPRQLSG